MIEVRRCRRAERGRAAAVLAASFAADPAYRTIFPDPRTRPTALRRLLRAPVGDAQRHGTCWVAHDGHRVVGAAAWQAPGEYPWPWWRALRAVPHIAAVAFAAPASVPRLVRFGRSVDARFPDDPVWYLQLLGVAPGAQGRGVGTRLAVPGIERADAAGVPCHLETDNPAVVPFYERLGFTVVSEDDLLPGSSSHRSMRRDPSVRR